MSVLASACAICTQCKHLACVMQSPGVACVTKAVAVRHGPVTGVHVASVHVVDCSPSCISGPDGSMYNVTLPVVTPVLGPRLVTLLQHALGIRCVDMCFCCCCLCV